MGYDPYLQRQTHFRFSNTRVLKLSDYTSYLLSKHNFFLRLKKKGCYLAYGK